MKRLKEIVASALGKDYCEGHDAIVDETNDYIDPHTGLETMKWCHDCANDERTRNEWVRIRNSHDPK